ncbi:MAG: sensor histidine kinase [Anaerolineae bacterium]
MNRLWVRLTLAFALVVWLTVSIVAVLVNLTAGRQFRQYLVYSGIPPQQALVDRLADYYRLQGSWRGIDWLLERVPSLHGPMPGMMRGTVAMREGPPQIVLADPEGRVIYDGVRGRPGRKLTDEERLIAQSIEVEGKKVGQLVVALPMQLAVLGPLELSFLRNLRVLLIFSALLVGGLGLLLGLALSRSLTAPLQRLATAARTIAGRDFSRRVRVDGSAELAEVARAFNEMAEALEQAERQRQNLVADVAHELRTPLSVLQGNLRAILDDIYPLDKAEISKLYDETRLLSRLVDDLRDLALADAGQLRLTPQPTDTAAILHTTVDALALAAEAQGVRLELQLPPDLPVVQADPDRLAQVLRNLLVNALRHTPSGGLVTVTASPVGNAVEFAVTDTGEGIAPEDLPHVFDRFWRAERSRARDSRWEGGSGLGLSVAQTLVHAMGGRIWAESAFQRGSTFRFTVPLA